MSSDKTKSSTPPMTESLSRSVTFLKQEPSEYHYVKRASSKDAAREAGGDNLYFFNSHLSKEHAVLKIFNDIVYIRDCSSTFGTVINDKVIIPNYWFPLQNFEVVRFIILKPSGFIQNVLDNHVDIDNENPHTIELSEYEGNNTKPSTGLSFKVNIKESDWDISVRFDPITEKQLIDELSKENVNDLKYLIHKDEEEDDDDDEDFEDTEDDEEEEDVDAEQEAEEEEGEEDGHEEENVDALEDDSVDTVVQETEPLLKQVAVLEINEGDESDVSWWGENSDRHEDYNLLELTVDEEESEDDDVDEYECGCQSEHTINFDNFGEGEEEEEEEEEEDDDDDADAECYACDHVVADSSSSDESYDNEEVKVFYISNRKRLFDDLDDDYDEEEKDTLPNEEESSPPLPKKLKSNPESTTLKSIFKAVAKEALKGSLYAIATVVALGVYGQSMSEE